jgi:MoaA/NifB/PqqE/SkfB family radical SAM enzyme
LDAEQISELFKSDNLHFRKIAAKTTVDDFGIYSGLFFENFLSTAVRDDLIYYACRRFPSLRGGYDSANAFVASKKYLYFAEYAAEHALFLTGLQDYFRRETCTGRQRQLIENLSVCFAGLKNDLPDLFPQYRNLCIDTKEDIDRQLMIFITGKCNLNCAYCFSGELEPSEISPDDMNEILEWASRHRVARISLCGGEPTLHSRFDEILAAIERYGFKTYFASNFTVDCSAVRHFSSGVIDKIYVHLTNRSLENRQLRNRTLKNIEYAREAKIGLACRVNIADRNPPAAQWFQFLNETGIRELNVAMTFPAHKANNQYVDIRSFGEYRFIIEQIIADAAAQNVEMSFAKPVPLCIFDGRTGNDLIKSKKFYPLCSVNEQNCTHNLCIDFNREFHACLGVKSSSLKFRREMEWSEVERFCAGVIRPLLAKPLWSKCTDCFLFDRKLCQGVCLSYKSI